MAITAVPFGTTSDGRAATLYQLSNAHGMTVGVTDLGACLVSCRVPDGSGRFPDVVLGYDGAAGYESNIMAFGGVVGRVAGRISGASFELNDARHQLTANNDGNALHGGRNMWFNRSWQLMAHEVSPQVSYLTLKLSSPAGDQGFPGSVAARVTYALTETDELRITYVALPSEPTPINLTCHMYLNLNGHAAGDVDGHTLQLTASHYLPVDGHMIPTGELAEVAGTPYDFREAPTIGAAGIDYDDTFVFDAPGSTDQALVLTGDRTGIRLALSTTAPAIQVFTAGGLDERCGKDGAHYGPHAGVALETQLFPDAIHHRGEWPASTDPVFSPQRPFESTTVLAFGEGPDGLA